MNLTTLHQYLGQLLKAGVSPDLPVAGITEGWPNEISDVRLLSGSYFYDPSPKMVANVRRDGMVLALVPTNEDVSELLNKKTHEEAELPVEPPYPT